MKARQALDSVVETKVEMSPEDKATLQKIARHRKNIAGWHPGDDSPFAYEYGGYTVSDTRSRMTAIKQDIDRKYGIVRGPSPEAQARQDAKRAGVQDQRKSIDAQVREKFPDVDIASSIMGAYQYRYGPNGELDLSRVKRRLKNSNFANVSAAAKYHAHANKLKKELLIKAGIRKRW
jgi:hypothetical protein